MKKQSVMICFCLFVQALHTENPIKRDKIKQELVDTIKKCELGKEPDVSALVPAVTCLCQTFPLYVIAQCKTVCLANAQLEQEVKNVEEQQQKEFLKFINQYIGRKQDEIPQALSELKKRLGTEGMYTRKTVHAVRVCDAVMRAINLAAALKVNELEQLETLVAQVGVKDKNYSSLYLLQLDAAPNPLSVFMTQRSYDKIIGSLDVTKNPLSTYFGSTKTFFEKAGSDIRAWQAGSTAAEDLKAVLARKKQALIDMSKFGIPDLPEGVAIKGQK